MRPMGARARSMSGCGRLADELNLPEFGLICRVEDVYRDTPLG